MICVKSRNAIYLFIYYTRVEKEGKWHTGVRKQGCFGMKKWLDKSERIKKAVKKIGKSLVEWYKLYNFAAKFE